MDPIQINQRKIHRAGLTHVPSRPWYGALIVILLIVSLAVLLSYTLLDWGWQQQYGHRNYWVAGGISMIFAFALRAWRNDPRRRFGTNVAADVVKPARPAVISD